MKTFIRYITIIIAIYVLAAAALLVMCPLWSVIGFKVCGCVAIVIGLTWFIPLNLYIHTHEQIDDLDNKVDELLRRTKKNGL